MGQDARAVEGDDQRRRKGHTGNRRRGQRRQAAGSRLLLSGGHFLSRPKQRFAAGAEMGRSGNREEPEGVFHAAKKGADPRQDGEQKRSNRRSGKVDRASEGESESR